MPTNVLKPAIRAALRMHEIGNGTPYKLYFAGKAKSGGSFGFMQGDLAAGQPVVTSAFRTCMSAAGISQQAIQHLLDRLGVHVVVNPLTPAETNSVNAALDGNRATVDEMDETILQDVYRGLDDCIAAASSSGRSMTGRALLYAACWINMSGPPSKLLDWLSGHDPHLVHPVPTAPQFVGVDDVRTYLLATDYYTSNPGNVPHLDESVQSGAVLLPT